MIKHLQSERLQTIAEIAASSSLSITAAALAFWSYWVQQYIGFPDGFITEFGQAQKTLLLVFILINILFCSFYLSLPFFAKKNSFWKRLAIGSIFYVIFTVIFFMVNHYLYLKLNHSMMG